ncbi:KRAB [Lepeophtheirus salmonis]|uniref:KRAB n=1 Tax=Lepeophtheirus salmonis TaxID=72036 RepID=A0A7R8D0G6_LEPSM|nr:KRAB [Lepeophtheirus salmonis]CAF2983894.1 KRAB [Lepeophtheirus salmonis]
MAYRNAKTSFAQEKERSPWSLKAGKPKRVWKSLSIFPPSFNRCRREGETVPYWYRQLDFEKPPVFSPFSIENLVDDKSSSNSSSPTITMADDSSSYPCSICKTQFENPKDLGTHILKQHCIDGSTESFKNEESDEEMEEEDPMLIMEDDDDVDKSNNEWAESLNNHRFNNIIKDLPRSPTTDESNQQFMIHRMSDYTTRYICLICCKAYTSRYNIRMHMNLHLGRNVHSCKFCGRFFAHKHVYESHLRTHTGEKPFPCNRCGRPFSDRSNCSAHQKKCRSFKTSTIKLLLNNNNDLLNNNNNTAMIRLKNFKTNEIYTENAEEDIISSESESESSFGPQIISVETCNEDDFSVEDLEEIQIEPDIIDYEEFTNNNNTPISNINRTSLSEPQQTPDKQLIISKEEHSKTEYPKEHSKSLAQKHTPPPKFKQQEYLFNHLSDHVNIPKSVQKEDYQKGYFVFYFTSRLKAMCLFCGKIFASESQVKIHINIHYDENIYNCRFCEKVFSDFKNFELHIKTHSEEFKYSCRYCENAFMSRMNLLKRKMKYAHCPHLNLFSTQSVKSEYPNNEFEDSSEEMNFSDDYIPDNNSNNVINKSAIQPPPTEEEKNVGYCLRQLENGQTRFICVRCGKHYTTNYNMRQHINIHTGKGLHTCRFCKRSFTHKHVWEHCPKDFADRSNYNSHRKLCALTKQRIVTGNSPQYPNTD